jgi:hypothetical protein
MGLAEGKGEGDGWEVVHIRCVCLGDTFLHILCARSARYHVVARRTIYMMHEYDAVRVWRWLLARAGAVSHMLYTSSFVAVRDSL